MDDLKKKIRFCNALLFLNVAVLFTYQLLASVPYNEALEKSYSVEQMNEAFMVFVGPILALFIPAVFLGWRVFKLAGQLADDLGKGRRELTFKEWHGF